MISVNIMSSYPFPFLHVYLMSECSKLFKFGSNDHIRNVLRKSETNKHTIKKCQYQSFEFLTEYFTNNTDNGVIKKKHCLIIRKQSVLNRFFNMNPKFNNY